MITVIEDIHQKFAEYKKIIEQVGPEDFSVQIIKWMEEQGAKFDPKEDWYLVGIIGT